MKQDEAKPPKIENIEDLLLLAKIRGGLQKLVGAKVIIKVPSK